MKVMFAYVLKSISFQAKPRMNIVKPALGYPAERATAGSTLYFGSCSRLTSPKLQELQARSEAAHANVGECKNCRMRRVGGADQVECLMEIVHCQWAKLSVGTRYCEHPSATQFCSVY
ncbi:MAG: hypothetical protein WC216_03600 [Gallionella sp.]|jgi:hypothetical protein